MLVTLKFRPQKWADDQAYPHEPLGPDTWQIDSSLIDFDFEKDDYKRDDLRFKGDAPQWVRDWSGPFEVDTVTDLNADFQLYGVSKKTNKITHTIGKPDTLDHCHNFKRAYDGTYQPISWQCVLEAGLEIGHQLPKT